jgi:hypothetical protein
VVLTLEVWALPVVAGDHAAAVRGAALAGHRPVIVIEEGVVGGQFLARLDVAHRDQDDVAGEADVRVTGVVDEEHHRLVLVVGEGRQVQVVGDLDLGVLQPVAERAERGGRHDVAALDRDDLVFSDRRRGDEPAAGDLAVDALGRLRSDP